MKVALLAGHGWLRHEGRLLRHLVVGLADETVRVVPIIPAGSLRVELPLVTERLSYRTSRWRALTGWRVRRLAGALGEMQVDVVHCVDGEETHAAAALARACGAPLVVSTWAKQQLGSAFHAVGAAAAGGMVVVPTQPLREEAERQGGPDHVRLVKPGVIRPPGPSTEPLSDPSQSLTCAVVSHGEADGNAMALLEGVAQVAEAMPQLQLFLHTTQGGGRALWAAASKLGLLDRINLVGADPSSQSLLVQCDAVLTPQPIGTVHTLVLGAMLAGRPVIGPADPVADYLHEGRTAHLLDQPTARDWAATLRSLVDMPEAMRQLGRSAQQYVTEHHSAAGFVEGLLAVYEQLHAAPIRFRDQA